METVFITIHDLSLDARIKFCSDSIEDILGYLPFEVKGKSCWEYFHPDEIPFAKSIHHKGIDLDKAAVLNYCRIKHKNGDWVACECVFTIVHDVLVASTSIYKRGPKAKRRAVDGTNVRRIFSSSPKDPRYHMLTFLSGKFYQEPKPHYREPRAALFLNRFTRSSTVMYATNSVSNILGVPADQITGKSFYYCIAENCLADSVKCIESAKANDSIAYLRFWYRDPTQPDARARSASVMDLTDSEEDDDGGVRLDRSSADTEDSPNRLIGASLTHAHSSDEVPRLNGYTTGTSDHANLESHPSLPLSDITIEHSRESSGNSTDLEGNAHDAIFDQPALDRTISSATPQDDSPTPPEREPIEVEAIISCSSDGLIVILRHAHPLLPHQNQGAEVYSSNGIYAAPWANQPILPDSMRPNHQASIPAATEPDFMAAIRDVAVFAWSLTGINGSMSQFKKGKGEPMDEALPPGGLVEWDPHANVSEEDNARYNGFAGSAHRPQPHMGDPVNSPTSSDDEVVWKRQPVMSSWRKPKRRAHDDAFGEDGVNGDDGESEGGSRKRPSKTGSGSTSRGDSARRMTNGHT